MLAELWRRFWQWLEFSFLSLFLGPEARRALHKAMLAMLDTNGGE